MVDTVCFILMSIILFFGQIKKSRSNTIEVTSNIKEDNVSAVSSSNSMNFVLWFMGSKQDPNGTYLKKEQVLKKTSYNIWFCSKPFVNQSFLKKQ
jgi:hypothetical protein